MAKPNFTPEFLRDNLRYDPNTGEFTWRVNRGAHGKKGAVAGSPEPATGYWRVGFCGRRHLAHRLAIYYVTGIWPEGWVDHRNGDGQDNRLSNLRECTPAENLQNVIARKPNNPSGHVGVSWSTTKKRWHARIGVSMATVHLGYFGNLEDAKAAYLKAKTRYHGFQPTPREECQT